VLGENGCGKSTVLKAAALVLAGSEALAELLEEPDSWIRLGQDRASLQAELVTAKGEERTISLEIQRGQGLRELFALNGKSLEKLDDALSHSMRNYPVVGYGVSRRLGNARSKRSRPLIPFRNPRSQCVATLFSSEAELNPLQTWAVDLHYEREEEGLRLISQTLKHLLPGVEFSRIDRPNQELLFHTPDGEIPLRFLSDGYQNMAAWCGDLLYMITQVFDDYRNPLAARGLLLIDEIDLHLHPVWQRQLKHFLDEKLPHFQIVATTHSPLTAHQTGEGELFFLKRDKKTQSPILHQFQGSARNLMIHQLIASPMFGLQTLDSRRVEMLRNEYRSLKDSPSLSPEEKARLRQISAELEDLPDFNAHTDFDQKRLEVLEKIEQALADDQKINGIKAVREVTMLGLKEGISKAEAEAVKKFEEAEATNEVE
jgi:predicted ATP-binding protein involved in virulence